MTSSSDPNAVFDNALAEHRAHVTLERDPSTLMRVLELFSLRGTLPLRLHFDAYAGAQGTACLRIVARLGRHDWRVLCARASTLVGVIDVLDGVPPGELMTDGGTPLRSLAAL